MTSIDIGDRIANDIVGVQGPPENESFRAIGDSIADQVSKEAFGFLPVTAQMGMRAARAVADSSVRTIDRAGYGWSLIWQHLNNLAGQLPDMTGNGGQVHDRADFSLPRAIAPISALTGHEDADALDVLGLGGRLFDADAVRKAQSEKLGSWEMSAAIAGELASYAIPGTPIHGLGAGMGNLARNATEAIAVAAPASRYLNRLVKAGKMTEQEAAGLMRSGNVLLEIAKREGAGKVGQLAAQAQQGLPGVAGDYAALLAQSYASAPQSEANDVLKNTALMAPLFLGVSRAASALSGKLADRFLSKEGKAALLDLYDNTQNGRTPSLWKSLVALPAGDKAKLAFSELMLAGLESTAFTATNKDAMEALMDAASGKPGSWGKFVQTWSGTTAGVLFNKGVPWAELPYFKRTRPDLNSIRTEQERQQAEKQQAEQKQRQEQQAAAQQEQQGRQEFRQHQEKVAVEAQRQQEQAANVAMASPLIDPLLRSGLTIESQNLESATPEIALIGADGARVTVQMLGQNNMAVQPSESLWRLVRPGVDKPESLSGPEAAQFLTDLGVHSVAQQARGTLHFSRLGFTETEAGGWWRDPQTGLEYKFGLDGKLYRRESINKEWNEAPADDPVTDQVQQPLGPTLGQQEFQSPEVDEWSRFLHQKERAFPEPAVDELLNMAVNVAKHGGDSQSAQEMRAFLAAVPPAAVAQAMTPETSKAIAHSIGAIAGGLSNHVEAQRLIQEAAARKAAQAPAAEAPKAEGEPQKPEEPPPGVTLSELYGGIPLKELGKAFKGFAELVVTGDKDREQATGRTAPTRKEQPDKPGGLATSQVGKYHENLPDVIGRFGGDVGKEIKADIDAANDLMRQHRGELEAAGMHDAVQRAMGKGGYASAKDWLETSVPDESGTATNRLHLILEGIDVGEDVPEKAQEIVNDYKKFFRMLGEFSEQVDTIRPNREGGYERFRAREPGRSLAVRSDMTDVLPTAFENPLVPINEKILRAVAGHPRNEKTPEQVEQYIKQVKEDAIHPERKSIDLKSATEIRRTLKYLPDEVTIDGETVRLRSKLAADTLVSMVRSELEGVGARRAFGQDLPEAAKRELGYTRPGPTKTIERLVEASGGDKRAREAIQKTVERFEGKGDEPFFKNFKGPLRQAIGDVETLVRTAMISGSWKQNLVEPLATASNLAGMHRVVGAMLRAGFSPLRTLKEAREMGAVIRNLHGTDIKANGGVAKAIASVVALPHHVSQSLVEAASYLAGKSMADSIAKGGMTEVAKERMRMLGMSENDIAAASENFTPELQRNFIRRFVRETTGAKAKTEGSYLSESKKWKAIRAFDRWFMSRIRGTVVQADRLAKAWASGSGAEKVAATQNALQFFLGSTAAGLIGTYISMLMKDQDFEAAYDHLVRDLHSDGLAWGLAKLGFGASVFGGTGQAIYQAVTDKSKTGLERAANLAVPTQRAGQVLAFLGNEGPYRDQDLGSALLTSLERTLPASQDLAAIGAITGLTAQAGPFRSAHNAQFKAMRDLGFPIGKAEEVEAEDVPFKNAMRKLDLFIKDRAGDHTAQQIVQDPGFQQVMQDALAVGKGSEIAGSLMARRTLEGKFDEQQMEKIRQRVGDANMNVLFAHDRAMEMLAKAFRKEKGTERHIFPAVDERLQKAEELIGLGSPGSVWNGVHEEVMQEAVEAVRSGVRPSMDVRRMALAMSRHPETLHGIVSDEKIAVLRRASAARAAQLMEMFLLESVNNRVASQLRKAHK
jgi:hypothetical protein